MLIFQTLLQQTTSIKHTSHLQVINNIDKNEHNSSFQSRARDPSKNVHSYFGFGAVRTLL